jgi:hypothetical protein
MLPRAEDAFLARLKCMRELVPINRTNVSRRNAEGQAGRTGCN